MDLTIKTPNTEEEFTNEWVEQVLRNTLKNEGQELVKVVNVSAKKNEVQGILSTTFILNVDLIVNQDEALSKSIFVKVPLKSPPGTSPEAVQAVNCREVLMLKDVLPKLDAFLDEKCQGFFRLPMPKTIHCQYNHDDRDVFVMENLLADGFYNFSLDKCLNEDHMKAVLDCLCYLHGTGLAFKKSSGGRKAMKESLSNLDEQIQLDDLIENQAMRNHFARYFRSFLHYLEDAEPSLSKHVGYMRKMHKHIIQIVKELENCGFESLITLAHGDAKPNNFMFRTIEIDLEDLECEGIDTILVDWQGGFVGSVANDLMWALFPFVENNPDRFSFAVQYYFDMLKTVLSSFNYSLADLDVPDKLEEFSSLLKKCLILELLTVTVIKPIMSLEDPEALRTWHKETMKNKKRRFPKKLVKPDIFSSPRFPAFCHLYFRIATSLKAFQELGSMYFRIMKDSMFQEDSKFDAYDSDEEEDTDLLSRILNAPTSLILRTSGAVVIGVLALVGVWLTMMKSS